MIMLPDDWELEKKEEDSNRKAYGDVPVTCGECDWAGKVDDCETEMDSEGWEYPEYLVLICPKCGGSVE